MKYLSALIAVLIVFIFPVYTRAEHTFENTYIYDCWGFPQKSIPAFELVDVIDKSDMGNVPLMSLDDVYISNGKIYLIDSVESRLNIFDEGRKLLASIKVIRNEENKIVVDPETNTQLILKNPEGVFVKEDTREIYIADTAGERIIVLDSNKYYLKRVIEKPQNMVGVTVFRPSKIVVDNAGRIYVVVQGGREGIIELNNDGSFSRYFGVNKPRASIIEYFWKNLASEVQKEKMRKVFAPPFNNIDIDQEGFIYATTADSAAIHKVFRLNAKGENVLRRADKIVGDLIHTDDQSPSMFVDIAVSDFGAYALLDRANGKIFIYSFEGDLLNIFGGLGYSKGNFQEPTGIAWEGKTLVVTDKKLAKAFIFQPTRFGEVALGAVENYYHGRWDEAAKLFEKALAMNSNYDVAYVGIGRNLLMQDRYEEAMYYLKLGNDKEYYSKAYSGYRNLIIQKNFGWFVVLFLIFVVYIVYTEYKYIKSIRQLEKLR